MRDAVHAILQHLRGSSTHKQPVMARYVHGAKVGEGGRAREAKQYSCRHTAPLALPSAFSFIHFTASTETKGSVGASGFQRIYANYSRLLFGETAFCSGMQILHTRALLQSLLLPLSIPTSPAWSAPGTAHHVNYCTHCKPRPFCRHVAPGPGRKVPLTSGAQALFSTLSITKLTRSPNCR